MACPEWWRDRCWRATCYIRPVSVRRGGLTEEAVKLFALVFLTRYLVVKSVRDGMILGATGGLRFAPSSPPATRLPR